MTKGTILMIGNYLEAPRHNRNIWQDLSEKLTSRGWQVITTSTHENQVFRLLDMLTAVMKYRKHYNIAQIDVFSGLAFVYAELCSIILKILDKPIVLTLHGGKLPEFAEKNKKRMARLLNRAYYVVTPSPFLQISLKRYRNDIELIPNPVDNENTHYRVRSQPKPNLVWIRAFHNVYNPLLPVKALKSLSTRYPLIKLTMIGPDKGDNSLQDIIHLATSLDVSSMIEVIPGITHEKVADYLDQNDIFLNSSNYDTAPRSVIEAMASGLCVVSTNVGGLPWIITDNEEGLLVEPDNPEEMGNAIKKILADSSLATRISENAHKKALLFNWDSVLAQWDQLFSQILLS